MKKLQEPAKVNHVVYLAIALAVVLGGWYTIVQASLVSGPDIISPPDSVEPSGATNDDQQAFPERQGVTLDRVIQCDTTLIPAGTVVDSHMIFLNTPDAGTTVRNNRVWNFGGEVICVMSNSTGLYQLESNSLLRSPSTVYPTTHAGRGFENEDDYTVNGNEITVSMTVDSVGDWIRVVTASSVPEDNNAPSVRCELATNPNDKTPKANDKNSKDGGSFVFTAIDDVDGELEIEILDTGSGQPLGPIPSGSVVKHNTAKGSVPILRIIKEGEYQLRTQGSIELSATDEAGHTATATCE